MKRLAFLVSAVALAAPTAAGASGSASQVKPAFALQRHQAAVALQRAQAAVLPARYQALPSPARAEAARVQAGRRAVLAGLVRVR